MNYWIATCIQLIVVLLAAPILPGLVQAIKTRLQGRPGVSVLQPYRELARLWRKSSVEPEGTSMVYQLAPAISATSMALACALLPLAWRSRGVVDLVLIVGLVALARLAVSLAAWDTTNGFGLMGASRDLTYTVFVEPVMLLALAGAALSSRSTDLTSLSLATAGFAPWSTPIAWCSLLAFALVMLAETGRQPIDNPDTHLELTMIHEGPLLEYAGRDLAMLQWSAAARHWLVIVLAGIIFLPHSRSLAIQLSLFPIYAIALCFALAFVETATAKMRILLVPRLLLAGSALALLGIAVELLSTGGGA